MLYFTAFILVALHQVAVAQFVLPEAKPLECKNDISTERCLRYERRGHCQTNRRMYPACRQTCGYCSRETCKDLLEESKCKHLQAHRSCQINHQKMKIYCPKTCGFCDAVCADMRFDCYILKLQGHCHADAFMMRMDCAYTCGFCGPKTVCDGYQCPVGHKCQIGNDGQPLCVCKRRCKRSKNTGPVCASNGKTYPNLCAMYTDECKTETVLTAKYFGLCRNEYSCADAKEIFPYVCEKLKKEGECEKNKEVMEFYCAKTCQTCRQPAPRPCESTKWGCCWNNDQPATGRFMIGCGPCKDELALCRMFQNACGWGKNGNFMKKHCPATCRYCLTPEVISSSTQGRPYGYRYK